MPEADPQPYGLRRPTLQDAHDALHRVHGHNGPEVWAQLLASTRVSLSDPGEAALTRLLDAMTRLDPVSRLCAQALRIRLSAHTHLGAAHTLTRS